MIKRGNQQNVTRDEVLQKSGALDDAEERVQEMVNEQKMALPDAYQKYEILKTWTLAFDVMMEATKSRI